MPSIPLSRPGSIHTGLLFAVVFSLACLSWQCSPKKSSPETAGKTDSSMVATPATAKPTPQQLAWQRMETIAFAHFTVNTFTDKEWGDGTESPKVFNPTAFNARQWATAC